MLSRLLWIVITAIVWSCSISAINVAQVVIDRRITVQPIQVAMDDGSNVANPSMALHEAFVDAIWAQAGIDVHFLPATQFNSTLFHDVVTAPSTASNFYGKLVGLPGHGQHTNRSVMNMFFVRAITDNNAFGTAGLSQNGFVVANRATNRFTTISHELGHNLGLDHTTLGSVTSLNVMWSSTSQPQSTNDIITLGGDRGLLVPTQIAQARISRFAVRIEPYLYPPVQGPVLATAISEGLPVISITAQIGQIFQFEYSSPLALLSSDWNSLALPSLVLSNATQSIIDTTFTGDFRFYRARLFEPVGPLPQGALALSQPTASLDNNFVSFFAQTSECSVSECGHDGGR